MGVLVSAGRSFGRRSAGTCQCRRGAQGAEEAENGLRRKIGSRFSGHDVWGSDTSERAAGSHGLGSGRESERSGAARFYGSAADIAKGRPPSASTARAGAANARTRESPRTIASASSTRRPRATGASVRPTTA